MKINEKSWHFRIANLYGKGEFYRRTDLCTYLTRFFVGSFFWCCAVLLGTFFALPLVLNPLLWVAVCIARGMVVPMEVEVIAALIAWGVMTTIALFARWAAYRKDQNKPILPPLVVPPLVVEAYHGWKDRYCVTVEFR